VIRYAKYSSRASTPADPEVYDRVREVLSAIEGEGGPAVRRYAEHFDGFSPEPFALPGNLIESIVSTVAGDVRSRIKAQTRDLRLLARAQLATVGDFQMTLPSGAVMGHRHVPVGSVGIYVPAGGPASVPAALMATVFAQEAGVRRVIASSPAVRGTEAPDPSVLCALHSAGIDRVLVLGGAQAAGALAFGVDDTPGVDMIVGAGDVYVTEAKRQLFGYVGVETLAGPAEFLIIADEDAGAATVARRILEHLGSGSELRTWLISTSAAVAESVMAHLESALAEPGRVEAQRAWNSLGDVLVCDTREEVLEVADGAAARRVELYTGTSEWFVDQLRNYGSIAVNDPRSVVELDGSSSYFPILPTGGAARFSEGLWVGSFLRALSYRMSSPVTAGAVGISEPIPAVN
jgi:sulfopropanediol 3-dehydrogenase